MTPERTELRWSYEPKTFFEAPYRYNDTEHELLIADGQVRAILRTPQESVDRNLLKRIDDRVQALFRVRQVLIHKTYQLSKMAIDRHAGSSKSVTVSAVGTSAGTSIGTTASDVLIKDANGNVHDSKAQRIAEHTSLLDEITPKIAASPLLKSLLESYGRAVNDPHDEFVHLYEIRDALSKDYGNDTNTRAALKISKNEWSRFGLLTCDEPLEQGRHRGNHPVSRRQANQVELQEVRNTPWRWIVAFARTLPSSRTSLQPSRRMLRAGVQFPHCMDVRGGR